MFGWCVGTANVVFWQQLNAGNGPRETWNLRRFLCFPLNLRAAHVICLVGVLSLCELRIRNPECGAERARRHPGGE